MNVRSSFADACFCIVSDNAKLKINLVFTDIMSVQQQIVQGREGKGGREDKTRVVY